MKTSLIIVDAQQDFLSGGILGRHETEQLIGPILELAQGVDLVIATRFLHQQQHFSFVDESKYNDGSWPPHCVLGTSGAELDPRIREVADYIVTKGMSPQPPDEYSVFDATTIDPIESTEEILQRYEIDNVIVAGFGWCVAPSALDARQQGYRSFVCEDAVLISEATAQKLRSEGVIVYHTPGFVTGYTSTESDHDED